MMLAVLSGLRSAATSSSREHRQSSATEHSPSQFLWCDVSVPTTVRNSSTLSNFKSALKSHLFTGLFSNSRDCTNSYDLWRRPWIGFTCYGAIEIIVVLLLLLLLLLRQLQHTHTHIHREREREGRHLQPPAVYVSTYGKNYADKLRWRQATDL